MRGLSRLPRLPRVALIGLVRAYRLLLSPWLGQGCRFAPSCSAYAIGALERHGAVVGSGLAAWRILRCHPLCEGGCDPVPDNMPWERAQASPSAGLFTGLLTRKTATLPAAATDTTNLSKTSK